MTKARRKIEQKCANSRLLKNYGSSMRRQKNKQYTILWRLKK